MVTNSEKRQGAGMRETRDAGRALGVICGLVVFAVTIYLSVAIVVSEAGQGDGVGPGSRTGPHEDARLWQIPILAGAGLAIAGSMIGRAWILVAGFAVGFAWNLTGVYFVLLIPKLVSLIGVGQVGYLVAAALMKQGAGSGGASKAGRARG